MIKIDLQKAYDRVEWCYLEQVMEALAFPGKFIAWLTKCLRIVNYTIVINSEPTETFDAARGPRQGDPISLFLFSIAMVYLSRQLNNLKERRPSDFTQMC